LEAKVGGDAFKLNQQNFELVYELEIWVETSEVTSCGHFWDLFSCLVVMGQEKAQTGKTCADSTHSSARIQSTRSENNLIASMGHDWPACFFGSPDENQAACKEEGFSTCKSYERWIGTRGRKAYRDLLFDRLTNFIIGLKAALKWVPGNPSWKAEAGLLLDKVMTQFGALTTFIESFYQKLTSVSKFTETRAWSLVGRCVGTLFEVQVRHQSEAALVEESVSLRNKSAVIGTVLKCHSIVESLCRWVSRRIPSL
jgi:hypothetical protein